MAVILAISLLELFPLSFAFLLNASRTRSSIGAQVRIFFLVLARLLGAVLGS